MTLPTDAGRLILVVEDSPTNLMLTRAVLQRAGYDVAEARTAEDALEQLQRARPVLILMDIHLPGIDGLTLTRRLKADPATADIPIVALTAHAMKDDQQRALAAGCDAYIAKPFSTRSLAGEIAAFLNRGRGDANLAGCSDAQPAT